MDSESVAEIIREALYVRYLACGSHLEEHDVLSTINWLFGTPIGSTRTYRETLARSILHGIDIEKVRADMARIEVERMADQELANMAAN